MEIDLVFGGLKGTAPDLSNLGRILATNPDNIKRAPTLSSLKLCSNGTKLQKLDLTMSCIEDSKEIFRGC